MMTQLIQKPLPGEYPPYAEAYLSLIPDEGLVLSSFGESPHLLAEMLTPLDEAQLSTPFAEGEWTIKEILLHVIDTERVLAYRALRLARQDSIPLPGFDHNAYVIASDANARSLQSLLAEHEAVRAATLALLASFDEAALLREGVASGHRVTVRALACFAAGHELHHLHSIQANYLAR